jgi:hypothetical protein
MDGDCTNKVRISPGGHYGMAWHGLRSLLWRLGLGLGLDQIEIEIPLYEKE